MTSKEIEILGLALDALFEAGKIEDVRKIVKKMAGNDTPDKSDPETP